MCPPSFLQTARSFNILRGVDSADEQMSIGSHPMQMESSLLCDARRELQFYNHSTAEYKWEGNYTKTYLTGIPWLFGKLS